MASTFAPSPLPKITPMRLRLVHQLSLLLVGTSLLAVLGMAALTATQLRRGFSDYLQAQDEARLARFANSARLAIERHGLVDLSEHPETLLAQLMGLPEPRVGASRERPGPPWIGSGGQRHALRPHEDRGLRGFAITSPDGRVIWGRNLGAYGRPPGTVMQQPIVMDGQTVAVAQYSPRRDSDPETMDAQFLQRQFTGLALLGGGTAALAALAAVLLARRWVRPLAAAHEATHRLAQGDFAHRLQPRDGRWRDELDDLSTDINRLAEGLQRLESSRRRWVAELSHELRTPLTVLRGELDAVADGVRPMNAERVASLQREVSGLTRLADDFALLARADLQTLPIERQPIEPAVLLQRTRERWHERLQAAGLRTEWHIEPLPARTEADGTRLQQVLDNLLSNTLAYTQAPGQVQVLAQRDGATHWLVSVDDSAPGVPDADERERLFEPLYRRDGARGRQRGGKSEVDDPSGGSGLGLSIARALVQAHGGSLLAEASPLGGLRLVMRLPL